jgi:L-threonylcarbamoyladenylate synthase
MGRVSAIEEPASDPGYRRFDCTVDDPVVLAEASDAARRAIEQGECIVLPTDTVYGIGADAFNADAVQRLLDAKERGRDMPPPVLIAESSLIRALATEVPEPAKDLVERHWPGPLTIICRRQPSLKMDLGDTEGTVALRVPDHPLAREILRGTGPMAVSSANLSGMPAALTCDEAIEQLEDRVAIYLDGGRLSGSGGAPSTIVDFTQSPLGQVLRRGALSVALLREICPDLEDLVDDPSPDSSPDPSTSSGRSTSTSSGHEPNTDELGITHPDHAPEQLELFPDGPRHDAPRSGG